MCPMQVLSAPAVAPIKPVCPGSVVCSLSPGATCPLQDLGLGPVPSQPRAPLPGFLPHPQLPLPLSEMKPTVVSDWPKVRQQGGVRTGVLTPIQVEGFFPSGPHTVSVWGEQGATLRPREMPPSLPSEGPRGTGGGSPRAQLAAWLGGRRRGRGVAEGWVESGQVSPGLSPVCCLSRQLLTLSQPQPLCREQPAPRKPLPPVLLTGYD